MNKRLILSLCGCIALCSLVMTGCSDATKGQPLSKTETEKFRAPLGQPMPAEAAADIARMQKESAEKMKAGGNGGPPPAAAPK